MRVSIFVPLFAAAALAQESSSTDNHPQTHRLTETDSRGVVTGQPTVVTSIPDQPPAETSIPAQATSVGEVVNIPAVGTGVTTIIRADTARPNATETIVVSANKDTTVILSTVGQTTSTSPTGSGSRPTGSGAEESGTPTESDATESPGAAATMRAMAGSVVGFGAFVAAFL